MCLSQPGYLVSRALLAAIGPVLNQCRDAFPGTEEASCGACLRHHLPERKYILTDGGMNEQERTDADMNLEFVGCRALDPRSRWTRFVHLRRVLNKSDKDAAPAADPDLAYIKDAFFIVKNSATMLGGSWGNAVAVGPIRGGLEAMEDMEQLYGEHGELAASTGLIGRQDVE